jgi:phosphatidylserine/phosphatidylglycerophosphate/cardiolipin synthase-like enzyme
MGRVVYMSRAREAQPRGHPAMPEPAPRQRTLLRLGYNCCAVARAERVAFLVDAEAYFRAFYDAALRAQRSITILAWDFNSQTRLHFDAQAPNDPPALLGEFLNFLVKRRRDLHVHVLNWDYPMVFGTDRELPPLYGFGWTPHRRVHLRYDDTHPVAGCQHQKVVVIDEQVAFVGGIDLTVRRWDRPDHAPDDERRTADGKAYPPFHDLMVALDGDAARALAALTRERWLNATGSRLRVAPGKAPATVAAADPWPAGLDPALTEVEVGIARTAPPHGEQPGIKEVERLYLDMIRAARDSIYIENQYFTSPRIAAAIEERLAEPDGPEVVLVLRLLSHGWLEEATMHVLRARLIARLRAADPHGRFHVYTPHIPGLAEGCCLDVHSKLMIVDDRVLRVGSANLCNRSMSIDTECDVAIESRGEARVAQVITAFRDRLVAEHLGVPPEALQRKIREHGTLHGAIGALQDPEGRSLRPLENLPDYPDALINVVSVADPDEPISLDFLKVERTAEEPCPPKRRGPAWGKLAAIGVVVAALTAAWRFTPLAGLITAENVIGWAKEFGTRPWAPFAVMLAFTPACFIMFPRPLITLAAVIAFGPWLGFTYSLAGIVFSSVVTFYIGKRMRRDTVRRLAGPRLDEMVEVLKRHGLLAMTLLRLVPIAPFFVEGVVAGAVGIRLWHLAAGTALGLLPGTLTTTVFGDQIETALSGGEINWWIVGGAVAILATGIVLVKRWFSKMARRMDSPHRGALGRQPR